jgi:hypothetical protein
MMKYIPINATSSGDNVVLAGSVYPNMCYMVVSYTLLSDANVTITWKSNSTALSGPMPILASGGIATTSNFLAGAIGSPIGLFKTLQGDDDLILNLSGAANVGGHISIFVFGG